MGCASSCETDEIAAAKQTRQLSSDEDTVELHHEHSCSDGSGADLGEFVVTLTPEDVFDAPKDPPILLNKRTEHKDGLVESLGPQILLVNERGGNEGVRGDATTDVVREKTLVRSSPGNVRANENSMYEGTAYASMRTRVSFDSYDDSSQHSIDIDDCDVVLGHATTQDRFKGQLSLMRRYYSWDTIPLEFFIDKHVEEPSRYGKNQARYRPRLAAALNAHPRRGNGEAKPWKPGEAAAAS